MNFNYPYEQGPDSYVDLLDANGGRLYLLDQSAIGRAVCYENSNYRTILSAAIFGAISGTQRDALLEKYMQYLTFGAGVSEQTKPMIDEPVLTIDPNPVQCGKAIQFRVSQKASRLTILDISGRTVANWELNTRNNRTIFWNLQANDGHSVSAGTYFVRVTGSGIATTQSFVVVR
ncbi:MAG: T9SS type A sorting domain-containing protein [candidate division WOR-3 bacterium]|nr:T9SS type A sorting domain-containing protein [candidate division WOR-3 bacterium]MDH5684549.1 T9SS type A sorting domain-containing protein [candidate division WOR-3 bacterium]